MLIAVSPFFSTCPGGFVEQVGKCAYNNPYSSQTIENGLQKGVAHLAPLSKREIELGKRLFFDRRLSGDGSISCATCHDPKQGFSDGQAQSLGIGHQRLKRSSPTLWNVAYNTSYFWDGRAQTLEEQAKGPLFSSDEMGTTPEKLVSAINKIPEYRVWFGTNPIRVNDITRALATFERSLTSFSSRYDRYVYGETSSLNEIEIEGLQVFRSFVTRCTECHTPPLFTNHQSAIVGAPDFPGLPFDVGMEKIAQDKRLRGSFKIPTLRNIAKTAPYMHSGALKTLEEVVDFYDKGGGRAIAGYSSPYLHWHIRPMGLSGGEKAALVAFLKSLTDESAAPTNPWKESHP